MITVSTENIILPESAKNIISIPLDNIPCLTFATHNVRSFTNTAKQHYLLSLYDSYDIDIIGLQETNFKQQNAASFNPTHSQYISFFSSIPRQRTAFGVGLILKKNIAHHVFKHDTKLDRLIYVDLQFANRQKFRIINCYLLPVNLKTRNNVQQILTNW